MTGAPRTVIVGAGPTGLMVACQLLRRGVPCRIIDAAGGPTDASRAIGLSTRSLEIFGELGIAEEAVQRGHPIPAATFYSPGGPVARVATSVSDATRYPFMLSIPQSETENILIASLERLGGSVERGTKLSGVQNSDAGPLRLTLRSPSGEDSVEADWVIGADGAHSTVRKSLGIAFSGQATETVFVIVDAELDSGPQRGIGHYFFAPEGMLVVPLPNGSYRLAATVRPGDHAGRTLDVESLRALIAPRAPRLRVEALHNAGWGIAPIQIHTRVAERLRSGGCLLAGDAAHIYSPVGGQGMNGGIQDAHNLAWKLALVGSGGARNTLLDSYDVERHAVAQSIMKATSAQTRMATISSPLAIRARNTVISLIARTGALDRRMAPQLAQLDLRYSSPAVADAGRRGPQGTRIPDTSVAGPPGTPATVFGLLDPIALTLLVLGPEERSEAEWQSELAALDGLVVVKRLAAAPAADAATTGNAPIDVDGRLHRALRVDGPALCLVRPDGHIAFHGAAEQRQQLVSYLRMLA